MDKQSGKDFDRPAYKRLQRRMKKNDLLYIKSIDRLGVTMARFWSSGRSSPRKKKMTFLLHLIISCIGFYNDKDPGCYNPHLADSMKDLLHFKTVLILGTI